jgi:thiol-disulfide isomerase/thioredoxin
MKPKYQLLVLLCIIAFTVSAQNDAPAKVSIGDAAPPLRVRAWIKGTPVNSFEKGKLYVVEFWATWCRPSMAAMPRLSRLARKYRHNVTFLAIDAFEIHHVKTTPMRQIKALVDSMGRQMNFPIASEDTNFTAHDWFTAFDQKAGPQTTFVVDAQGRVAWIGCPHNLAPVLEKIMNNTWDIKAALFDRVFNEHWKKMDEAVIDKVQRFQDKYDHAGDVGFPDSTLSVINEMVKKRPDLKYAPRMVSYTFSALLYADRQQNAFEYGKTAIATATYAEPAYDRIIADIKNDSPNLNITPDVYHLGIACYQAEIDRAPYPELIDRAKIYRAMAQWYRLAGDAQQALAAEQKAYKFEKADFRKNIKR